MHNKPRHFRGYDESCLFFLFYYIESIRFGNISSERMLLHFCKLDLRRCTATFSSISTSCLFLYIIRSVLHSSFIVLIAFPPCWLIHLCPSNIRLCLDYDADHLDLPLRDFELTVYFEPFPWTSFGCGACVAWEFSICLPVVMRMASHLPFKWTLSPVVPSNVPE